MKLALVSPVFKSDNKAPPMNLAVLASYVREHHSNLNIKIFDGTVDDFAYEKMQGFQPDILGVTASTVQAYEAYDLLRSFKKENPNALTVLGGVHPSALPEEASKYADCVVVGEGEIALDNIISGLLQGRLPDRIVQGQEIADLNTLPFPAYDLLDMDRYIHGNPTRAAYWHGHEQYPQAMLFTSRGCNYRCPFCVNSKRKTSVRYYSAEKMIEDVKFNIENYGVKSIWFNDDDFINNKKRLAEFIRLFKAYGFHSRVTWSCQARVDDITKETVELIKDAGCVSVFLGIESVTPNSLAYLKNNTVTPVQVEKALKICHEAKLDVCGSFIFGSPKETLAEMNQGWNWILSHRRKGLTHVAIGMLLPFPSSTLYDYALEQKVFSQANIDYDRLVDFKVDPYVVSDSLSAIDFKKWFKPKFVLVWAGTQLATKNLRGMLTPTFLKCCLKHPGSIWKMVSG